MLITSCDTLLLYHSNCTQTDTQTCAHTYTRVVETKLYIYSCICIIKLAKSLLTLRNIGGLLLSDWCDTCNWTIP